MTTLTRRRPRRQPTEAQRAKAAERRTRMRGLARTISAWPKDKRAELAATFGVVSIEGRALSPFNSCMIWTQNPAASVVGGFRQWLRAGRCVAKGQHGLAIWVPCGKTAPDADPCDKDVSPDFFVLGTVFDISQTSETADGKAVA